MLRHPQTTEKALMARVSTKSSPTWLVVGLGLFTVATLIWLLFPLLSNGGAAAQMVVPRGLFSRIVPNYGSDNFGDVIRTLRLTIVRELSGDGMEQELLLPVPTATWRDFAGAPPYTATPTNTPTPTGTATPTETATPTHTATRRPTSTQKPTDEPTEKPKAPTKTPTITPTPSITPTPTPADLTTPVVSGANPSPFPGYLGDADCAPSISVSNIHVTDTKPSYGMSFIKLRYQVIGFSGFIFSNDLSPPDSGGSTPDGGWDALYSGSIVFEIDTAWESDTNYEIQLDVEVKDKGSNSTTRSIGTYTVDENCDGG